MTACLTFVRSLGSASPRRATPRCTAPHRARLPNVARGKSEGDISWQLIYRSACLPATRGINALPWRRVHKLALTQVATLFGTNCPRDEKAPRTLSRGRNTGGILSILLDYRLSRFSGESVWVIFARALPGDDRVWSRAETMRKIKTERSSRRVRVQ
jgi:hypothetical protein